MRRHTACFLAAAGAVGLWATAATAVVFRKGDDGDVLMAVTSSKPTGLNVTFICNGPKSEYGVVVTSDKGAASPEGGADVTIKADGADIGRHHFNLFSKALMLTINGPPGRAMFEKAAAAKAIALDVGGTAYAFTLADGKDAVARYRSACGL